MKGKKRDYYCGGYLDVSDLTETEKKEIWCYIYENSSGKKGEHDLDFAIREYMECMRSEGAIEQMLRICDDEDEYGHGFRNNPGYIGTVIIYAE